MKSLYRFILKRPFFKGQDRLFNFLFTQGLLDVGSKVTKPLNGDFVINCDTKTWIGARIFYIGDYETSLKAVFKDHIKEDDHVLDIGANIGFHTLYFAQLVGKQGLVTAFEPIPFNFDTFKYNIGLNDYENIRAKAVALGNKNETLLIDVNEKSTNPGSFNLFNKGGQLSISCHIGDELIKNQQVDFIKIDVEGYEAFAIEGLANTIKQSRPKIVFEFDINFHQKTGLPNDYIFNFLATLDYHFYKITRNGLVALQNFDIQTEENILALPNA